MKTDQATLVAEVFCDVIEKLAFMFGEPAEHGDIPTNVPRCLETSMTFTGAMNGSFHAVVPIEMCVEIAGNVLGMDPDDQRVISSATDAFKEMLNVVCGHVLTSLAGQEPVFNLSVPQTVERDSQGWAQLLALEDTVTVVVDDMPVLLRLEIQE